MRSGIRGNIVPGPKVTVTSDSIIIIIKTKVAKYNLIVAGDRNLERVKKEDVGKTNISVKETKQPKIIKEYD